MDPEYILISRVTRWKLKWWWTRQTFWIYTYQFGMTFRWNSLSYQKHFNITNLISGGHILLAWTVKCTILIYWVLQIQQTSTYVSYVLIKALKVSCQAYKFVDKLTIMKLLSSICSQVSCKTFFLNIFVKTLNFNHKQTLAMALGLVDKLTAL